MLDDLDIALMGISEVASTRMGHVTIACVPSAAYYFMPQVIGAFHQLYPRIRSGCSMPAPTRSTVPW